MENLIGELKKFKERIAVIHYWQDKELMPKFEDLIDDENLKKKLKPLVTSNNNK